MQQSLHKFRLIGFRLKMNDEHDHLLQCMMSYLRAPGIVMTVGNKIKPKLLFPDIYHMQKTILAIIQEGSLKQLWSGIYCWNSH